jgi:hypothetical protein
MPPPPGFLSLAWLFGLPCVAHLSSGLPQIGHYRMQRWLDGWKERAAAVRRDCMALYLAARDPRVPWHVKALAVLISA